MTKKPEALYHITSSEIAQGYTVPAITQTLYVSHHSQAEKV
jgi:hypothetical protein